MRSDRKQTILFIIILLILSMGIGYAFLTTTLSIDGTSDIDSAVWNVHFDNIDDLQTDGVSIISPATISDDGKSINFHIKLNEPGDIYEFAVDIINDGTLYAYIDGVSFKVNGQDISNAPSYLYGWVADSSDYSLFVGDILAPGEYKGICVGLNYYDDVDSEDLPTQNESLNVSVEIIYTQSSSGNYVYSVSASNISYGGEIPNTVATYNTYQEAISEFGEDFFVRYLLYDNKVYGKSIGFIKNGQVYYLIGENGSLYNKNVQEMNKAFGTSNCNSVTYGYVCSSGDLEVSADIDGFVFAFRRIDSENSIGCAITSNVYCGTAGIDTG